MRQIRSPSRLARLWRWLFPPAILPAQVGAFRALMRNAEQDEDPEARDAALAYLAGRTLLIDLNDPAPAELGGWRRRARR